MSGVRVEGKEMPRWDRTKGRPEPIRALNRIKERENGEPLVDIREIAPKLRILRPTVIPYVRQTVAEMVAKATDRLPEGYHFGLVEGWRPLARQQRIYDWFFHCAKEAFPDRNHAAIRRTICRFIAPTDQKAPPGHCTGAAVDIWPIDDHGEVIDVTSPWQRMGSAPTYVLGLTPEAERNRMILVNAMLEVGFSNCRDEWWHYSWGDAGWAVRMGEKECLYGLCHLEPALYADLETDHVKATKERINPFLKPTP